MKRSLCLAAGVIGLLMAFVAVIVQMNLPSIVKSLINKEVVLTKGSTMMDKWKNIPIPVYLDIYIFDYVNAAEYQKDTTLKPKVEQKGPYVFRVVRDRNISESNSSHIIYNETRSYVFEESLSGRNLSLSDTYTVVNLPFLGAASLNKLDKSMLEAFKIRSGEDYTKWTLFHECSVKDLIFDGCVSSDMTNTIKALSGMVANIQLNVLANYTKEGPTPLYSVDKYTMETGGKDISQVGHIISWNYSGKKYAKRPKYIPLWNDKYCNAYNGSDGTVFPPHVNRENPIYVFSQDVCRSLKMSYKRHETFKDFEVYRYTLAPEILQPYLDENKCFCNSADCSSQLEGVFDIGKCKTNIPLVASMPHFYGGDCKIFDEVDGLKPNITEHELFLDIEPRLGIPMRANKRVQVNLDYQKIGVKIFKQLEPFPAKLFPIMWMNERAELTDNLASEIRSMLDRKVEGVTIALHCMIVLGQLMAACTLGFIIFRVLQKKKQEEDMEIPSYTLRH